MVVWLMSLLPLVGHLELVHGSHSNFKILHHRRRVAPSTHDVGGDQPSRAINCKTVASFGTSRYTSRSCSSRSQP